MDGSLYAARIVAGKRMPIAAGLFYEPSRERLLAQLDWAFSHPLGPGGLVGGDAEAVVSPHGALFYSGPVAAHSFNAVARGADTVYVVVGPNHTGVGAGVSVYPEGWWSTPLGDVEVERIIVERLVSAAGAVRDLTGHLYEHSVEVQLPFMQYVHGKLGGVPRLVAVSVYDQSPSMMESLGRGLAGLEPPDGERLVVVFSANLSSYIGDEDARRLDGLLLEALESLDPREVYRVAAEERIPSCSIGILAAAAVYAAERGLRPFKLVYATSGDTGGDKNSVVGYAAVAFKG